jgi:hypothetical protein
MKFQRRLEEKTLLALVHYGYYYTVSPISHTTALVLLVKLRINNSDM